VLTSRKRAQFEVIARNEYTRTEDKNPVDCSLYYLALKKKAVLVGLWRMATWSREQAATQRLLSNNFDDGRWKTAALKNAYALMGKHRFGKFQCSSMQSWILITLSISRVRCCILSVSGPLERCC